MPPAFYSASSCALRRPTPIPPSDHAARSSRPHRTDGGKRLVVVMSAERGECVQEWFSRELRDLGTFTVSEALVEAYEQDRAAINCTS